MSIFITIKMLRHFVKYRPSIYCTQVRLISQKQPDRQTGVKADETSGNKYDYTKDKQFKSITFQIGAFIAIVFFSGKLMGFLVDRYMF